jgi:hypothetical protein
MTNMEITERTGGLTQQTRARRAVAYRTHGHRHGPITRLMSPSDLGDLWKPP